MGAVPLEVVDERLAHQVRHHQTLGALRRLHAAHSMRSDFAAPREEAGIRNRSMGPATRAHDARTALVTPEA